MRKIKYKDNPEINGKKHCSMCDNIKLIEEFEFKIKKKGKRCNLCKKCMYIRKSKYIYGIEPEDYLELSKKQDNKCKICNNPNNDGYSLCIDHCHITGKVRGLLCFKCNTGLGSFLDNTELLTKAIIYLQESK